MQFILIRFWLVKFWIPSLDVAVAYNFWKEINRL